MSSIEHYENFPVASWVGPPALRPAIASIYAFARAADDIADEGTASSAQRLEQLDQFERQLDRIEKGEHPTEAPFAALARTIRLQSLSLVPFRQLLSAFRQDVLKVRYATFDEVLDYSARSANPVGRLLLALYGVGDDSNLARSDAICTGLQITNFWQDVAVDWAKGRVYIPASDLASFGVDERHLAAGLADERWQRLMAFETARARVMLESGRPLATALPRRARLELNMVIAGGLRILSAIDRARGDVFRHRPRLRRRDWLAMLASALVH